MNKVILLGRITKDVEIRYTTSQMAIARFNIAVDRFSKDGEKQADFPTIVAFGKTAENVERFSGKGLRVLVEGRVQTGSYDDKDGKKVYTTEIVADRIQFIDWKEGKAAEPTPSGFSAVDEEIPF